MSTAQLPPALVPPYPFVQSRWWRAARHVRPDLLVQPGQPVNWVVNHTMQGGTATPLPPDVTAEVAAQTFATWDRQVSAHRIADTDSIVQTVADSGVAFTQIANDYTLTLETGGRAEWSREQWVDHDGLLWSIAASDAAWCASTGIPAVWIHGEDLAAAGGMLNGILDHRNLNIFGQIIGQKALQAYWRSDDPSPPKVYDVSHTDCGLGFPFDVVVDRVREILAPPTPEPVGGTLVNTVIKVADHWAVFAGDMDEQGVVHTVRHLTADLNQRIGLLDIGTPEERPALPGSNVLTRTRASMTDFSIVAGAGGLPFADGSGQPDWTASDFYPA